MLSRDLVVSGADTYLIDLDLTLDITHTWSGDLEITLTSPAGTVVVITTDNGGGSDDVFSGTLFDDQATTPATDAVYTNGVTATPLVPEGALAAFIGEDPNGTWTLDVGDDAGLDTGTINSWTLDVTTAECAFQPEPAIPTLGGVGVALLLLAMLGIGVLLLRRM